MNVQIVMARHTEPPSAPARADWPRRRFVLTTEQRVPRPLPDVFEFFADASNLNEITPPWLHFAIRTPGPIAMGVGTLIDYSIRLKGVPIRWRTRIAAWEPPHRFVDEQLRGPYALWHHEHTFDEHNGATTIRDRVTYALPLAALPGAGLVHRRIVRPDLERIFTFRRAAMARRFGAC
jgi:ligand-binding SRPBCC domain-containing protein